MDSRSFFNHVVQMREFQKEYFKSRSTIAMYNAKKVEKIIDDEIDRVMKIISNNGK